MHSGSSDFIQCPACKKSLPNSAARCHFCGADTSKVARAAPQQKAIDPTFQTPSWITGLYYTLAAWWIVGAVVGIMQIAYEVNSRKPDPYGFVAPGWGPIDYFSAIISGMGIIVGLGLFFKIEFIRNYVKWICFINIIAGLASLIGSILSIMLVGALGILFVISNILNIATAVGTIWLLAETSDSLW